MSIFQIVKKSKEVYEIDESYTAMTVNGLINSGITHCPLVQPRNSDICEVEHDHNYDEDFNDLPVQTASSSVSILNENDGLGDASPVIEISSGRLSVQRLYLVILTSAISGLVD